MNWLDIVVIIIIAISVFSGLKAGIIKALLTVVGVIVGVILAGRFSEPLGDKLTFISDGKIAGIVAFALILIVVMIAAVVVAVVIKKIAEAVLLGWVNRIGGAVLGLILGAIFCAALLTMWVKFQGAGDTVTGSALARFLVNGFPFILGFLPSDFDSVRSFFQ